MKRYLLTMTVLFLLACGAAFGQTHPTKTEDEKAIRANIEQMVNGWNIKSGVEFSKPFAEDSDYVVTNGMHINGRTAIAKGHQQIFDAIYKDSRVAITIKQMRFLRPDIAVVHSESNLTFKVNGEERKGNGTITLVMVKENGKWQIAAFQNTEVQTPAQQ